MFDDEFGSGLRFRVTSGRVFLVCRVLSIAFSCSSADTNFFEDEMEVDFVDFVLFDNFLLVTVGFDAISSTGRDGSLAAKVDGEAIDKGCGSSSSSELDIAFSWLCAISLTDAWLKVSELIVFKWEEEWLLSSSSSSTI